MSDSRPSSELPAPYRGNAELAPRETYYYPSYPGGPGGDEGMNWRQMASLAWQRKWWLVASLVLGMGVGYVWSGSISPVYSVQTRVFIEQTEQRSGPIRSTEVFQGAGWATIFQSYAVMVPVAVEERLYVRNQNPDRVPDEIFHDLEITDDVIPGRYELRFGSGGQWTLSRDDEGVVERGTAGEPIGPSSGFRWTPDLGAVSAGTPVRFRLQTPRSAALDVWRNLKVTYDGRASLILANLSWGDPEQAARILNALAERFIDVATDLKSRKIREEVEILEEQLAAAEELLEDAELALESHRVATITLPDEQSASPIPGIPGAQSPIFGDFFSKRLQESQLQADLRQLEQVLAETRQGRTPNLIALRFIPSVVQAPELNAAIQELQNKEVNRRTLLYRYTEEWPEVRQLTEEIRVLEQRTIPGLIQQIVNQLQDRQAGLREEIQVQAGELRQIPGRTIEQARRDREAQLHAQLYNDLKVRLNNARLAEATAVLADMQIVDAAVPPRNPTNDKGSTYFLMATFAGLGIGMAGVLMHDRLDRRIRYPGQVTTSLGLPVLGVVPRLNGKKTGSDEVTASVAIEAFRGIRTQLERAGDKRGKLTLVTSPAPREGKSMIAANLAISFASAGYRTALVDGDTRRGRAHQMFDLSKAPGLTDYLLERATIEKVRQATRVEGLTLVARGGLEGFNHDLLSGPRMDSLLEALGAEFDAIVIDGPPLAAGADALLLGEQADKVLLVVRAGSTDEELARAKLETIGNVDIHLVGTVLNAVPRSAPYYEQYVNYYYADAEVV